MRKTAIAVAERYGEDGDRCVIACIDRRLAGVELRKNPKQVLRITALRRHLVPSKRNCSYLPKNLPYGEEASCPQEAISRYCTVRFSTIPQASSYDLAQQPADLPDFTVGQIRGSTPVNDVMNGHVRKSSMCLPPNPARSTTLAAASSGAPAAECRSRTTFQPDKILGDATACSRLLSRQRRYARYKARPAGLARC